uniref:NADH-ubiquinone oxidoreductase chain 5 n=1 Tax=Physunio superbus TaxID=2494254 RepID=A0A8A3WIG2_9BIVA|nr:NADH dehydrogenase subunit 5 [Physunio superbus]
MSVSSGNYSKSSVSSDMSNMNVGLMLVAISFIFAGFSLCLVWFSGMTEGVTIFEWELFSACGFSFKLSVFIDYLSVLFSFVVCVISSCVFVFSVSYMQDDKYWKGFCLLVFAFVVSMNILIFLPNLVFVLLGWDLLGIVSFLLVIYYQNKSAVSAGLLTLLMNRIGDVLLILSIGVGSMSGIWGMPLVVTNSLSWLLVLLVGASMTKSAQVPFSVWLPAAMAAPTPVSALVHSSTLVTVGVYFLFRHFSVLSFMEDLLFFLTSVGCVTFLMGSLGACFEVDLKKLIASSTLGHLGFMIYSLGVGYPMLSVFHLLSHALFKSLLFLCAGFSIHSSGSCQDIRYMAGVGWSSPSLQVASVVISLSSLCGVPYLSGFYSKDAIIEATITSFVGAMEGFSLLVGAMSSCFYSLRLMLDGVYGALGSSPFKEIGSSKTSVVPFVALCLGSIGFSALIGSSWVGTLQVFNLSWLVKVTLFVVLNSGFISLVKGDFDSWLVKVVMSKGYKAFLGVYTFLGGMWFFRWSVLLYTKTWFNTGKMVMSVVELGWVEAFAGDLGFGKQLAKLSFNVWLFEFLGISGVLRVMLWVGVILLSWYF